MARRWLRGSRRRPRRGRPRAAPAPPRGGGPGPRGRRPPGRRPPGPASRGRRRPRSRPSPGRSRPARRTGRRGPAGRRWTAAKTSLTASCCSWSSSPRSTSGAVAPVLSTTESPTLSRRSAWSQSTSLGATMPALDRSDSSTIRRRASGSGATSSWQKTRKAAPCTVCEDVVGRGREARRAAGRSAGAGRRRAGRRPPGGAGIVPAGAVDDQDRLVRVVLGAQRLQGFFEPVAGLVGHDDRDQRRCGWLRIHARGVRLAALSHGLLGNRCGFLEPGRPVPDRRSEDHRLGGDLPEGRSEGPPPTASGGGCWWPRPTWATPTSSAPSSSCSSTATRGRWAWSSTGPASSTWPSTCPGGPGRRPPAGGVHRRAGGPSAALCLARVGRYGGAEGWDPLVGTRWARSTSTPTPTRPSPAWRRSGSSPATPAGGPGSWRPRSPTAGGSWSTPTRPTRSRRRPRTCGARSCAASGAPWPSSPTTRPTRR